MEQPVCAECKKELGSKKLALESRWRIDPAPATEPPTWNCRECLQGKT